MSRSRRNPAAVRRALVAAVAAAALRNTAHAQPAPPASPCPVSPADAATTLGSLVARVALQARPALEAQEPARGDVGVRVIAAVGGADAAGLNTLVARVEALVRGALGTARNVRRIDPLAAGDTAAAAARAAARDGVDTVAFVRIELDRAANTIALRGELVPADRGPWVAALEAPDRAPAVLATLFASARADAEVRAFIGPATRWPAPAARAPSPRRIHTPFALTLALAAVDTDGDGTDELAVLAPERLRIARRAGASLTFLADLPLPPPRAAAPLRQPLGALAYDPEARRLLARTSAGAGLHVLPLPGTAAPLAFATTNGAPVAGTPGTTAPPAPPDLYPAPGVGCVALAPGSFLATALHPSCDAAARVALGREPVAAVPVAVTRPDAHGARHRFEVRADGAGGATVLVDGHPAATLADIAPPLALEDLDDDGRVELFAASASAPGGPDRLRVFSIEPNTPARLEERPALAFDGPIEGLAVGDFDGDGARELVVGAHDPARRTTTLWIVP